jgi:hypothetical protein
MPFSSFQVVILLVVVLILMHSYHVDWCYFHPSCAHTDDICKGALGPSMAHLLNQLVLSDPDACSRGYRMKAARSSAYVCNFVPFRGTFFSLLA